MALGSTTSPAPISARRSVATSADSRCRIGAGCLADQRSVLRPRPAGTTASIDSDYAVSAAVRLRPSTPASRPRSARSAPTCSSATARTRASDPTAAPGVYMTRGFIQIAGFTFGKATSFFDFTSTAAVAYNAGMITARRHGRSRVRLLRRIPRSSATASRALSASSRAGAPARVYLGTRRHAGQTVFGWRPSTARLRRPPRLTEHGAMSGTGDAPPPPVASAGTLTSSATSAIDQAWGSAQVSGAAAQRQRRLLRPWHGAGRRPVESQLVIRTTSGVGQPASVCASTRR